MQNATQKKLAGFQQRYLNQEAMGYVESFKDRRLKVAIVSH